MSGSRSPINFPADRHGTPGTGARDAGSVAALVTAARAILSPRELDLVKPMLLDGQRDDGGWGKKGEKASDIETTYRVMRAFMLLKEKPKDVKKLRAFIESHRNKDGGYATKPGDKSTMSGAYYATSSRSGWTRWKRRSEPEGSHRSPVALPASRAFRAAMNDFTHSPTNTRQIRIINSPATADGLSGSNEPVLLYCRMSGMNPPTAPSSPTIAARCIACLRNFALKARSPQIPITTPKNAGISAVGLTFPSRPACRSRTPPPRPRSGGPR